jgi:hypothetical protein
MPEPVLVGLLFADKVITENNGKKGILGTFTQFNAATFPAVFPPWNLYAAVTNLIGKHRFALNLVSDENQVVVPLSGEFEVADPLGVVELDPMIAGAAFPRPGNYTLTFHVDGDFVGSRILTVRQL